MSAVLGTGMILSLSLSSLSLSLTLTHTHTHKGAATLAEEVVKTVEQLRIIHSEHTVNTQ